MSPGCNVDRVNRLGLRSVFFVNEFSREGSNFLYENFLIRKNSLRRDDISLVTSFS